jgi:hypothetical protein
MSRGHGIKQELVELMDFGQEVDDLLGTGKGNARHCFNKSAHSNNDKSPSLSFSSVTGAWKCHTCGEKGDIFTLYMKIHGCPFPSAFEHYLKKYGLWRKLTDFKRSSHAVTKRKKYKAVTDSTVRSRCTEYMSNWMDKTAAERLQFMQDRYGITLDTLREYKIGYSKRDNRVWIPVWVDNHKRANAKSKTNLSLPAIVNVRKHDCFRRWAQWYNTKTEEWIKRGKPEGVTLASIARQDYAPWTPKWDSGKSGKVISIAGHGAPYLYPAHVCVESQSMYLVGGELKALLLNQLGVNAVTFTTGEGGYAREWLPYFMNKEVRVLFDADPGAPKIPFAKLDTVNRRYSNLVGRGDAGLTLTEQQSFAVAQALADNGAYAQVGIWPDLVKKHLPDKGDVTDFLRLSGWNPGALDHLTYVTVDREEDPETIRKLQTIDVGEEIPDWDDVRVGHFNDLVDPSSLGNWIRVKAIVSGRGEVPYVVPSEVVIHCAVGESNIMPKCGHCSMPKLGFRTKASFPTSAQVELVGMSQIKIEQDLFKRIGIPKRCIDADVNFIPASVEVTLCTPTVEVETETVGSVELDTYEYAHRQVYLIGDNRIRVEENRSYEVMGKVMSDPKRGTFTLASTDWRTVDNDIFSFRSSAELNIALAKALHTREQDQGKRRDAFIADIRDNVVAQIYGQDKMIEAIALSWFLPFIFRINQHVQERVCPSVMILGDTTVGKSTATTKILRHFGAGRPHSANSDPTHAGLVGGNVQMSSRMSFSWGVLPTAHRALVFLDEYNKLSLDTIGKLTNVLSSGIAERTTVSGPRRTKAWVRLLTLCNPRGERSLGSYSDPLHAALQVAGTVQDLGRFEYVFIQHQMGRARLRQLMREAEERESVPHLYTRALARYHIQWAWHLDINKIKFVDPKGVFRNAMDLADRFGSHTVLLPAQARFKLGRVATAYATMLFSHDKEMNVVVTPEHVKMAVDFFVGLYEKYVREDSYVGGAIVMPEPLIRIFDRVHKFKRLRFLAISESWSREDLADAMGRNNAEEFVEVSQYELGLITRKRDWYSPKSKLFMQMVESYVNERERLAFMSGEAS